MDQENQEEMLEMETSVLARISDIIHNLFQARKMINNENYCANIEKIDKYKYIVFINR